MASNTEKTRSRADQLKADLLSVSTCSNATVATLQELLLGTSQDTSEKENSRAKAQAPVRKRGGTQSAAASGNAVKKGSTALAPKEKYILATEVANITLQTLSDALKNTSNSTATRSSPIRHASNVDNPRKTSQARNDRTSPNAPKDAHKPLKERSAAQVSNSPQDRRLGRASSSSSSPAPGVEAGLLAVAECARLAFAYMGTSEATKIVGKDKTDLQYENGLLVLAGKLTALGLDNMAVKELRMLKRRLEGFLFHGAGKKTSSRGEVSDSNQSIEKETIASLLAFDSFELDSPALPLVANLQTYVLRIIAKYKKPRVIETAWEHLQLSNPSSAANLITHIATQGSGQAKAARQLESLAQTLLSLCPSISSTSDASTSQPSPEVVLRLQQLAFKLRKQWWTLVQHKGNQEQELFEPFAKCVNAFARRSQLAPVEKYGMAKLLYVELLDVTSESSKPENEQYTSAVCKILCSLAQAAGQSDEVLRWLGSTPSNNTTPVSGTKETARLLRIANVAIDKFLKSGMGDIEAPTNTALDALSGTMEGLASDLESLFMEANALRRTATRLLVACLQKAPGSSKHSPEDGLAVQVIAASVRFSARFVGVKSNMESNSTSQMRHNERIRVAWSSVKSIVDSALTCCKQNIGTEVQWKELDSMLQELAHLLHCLEKEMEDAGEQEKGSELQSQQRELLSSCIVKFSNAYWAVHMQLKKSCPHSDSRIAAMRRSIDLVQSRSEAEKEAAHHLMKLEQLAYTLDGMNNSEASQEVYAQCVQTVLFGETARTLTELAGTKPPEQIFTADGPLRDATRLLRAFHSSVLKHGLGSSSRQAFYDDESFEAGGRGAMLEWQLSLFSRTLSRNRRWNHSLNSSLNNLTHRLQTIYQADVYPLRYMRLSIQLSDLSSQHPHIFPESTLERDLTAMIADVRVAQDCADIGLAPFKDHLTALLDLKLLLRQPSPTTSGFQKSFCVWESIVRSASSWETLVGRVDDIQDLLQSMDASVDYLNAKGEEYLALPVLHLLVKIYELQNDSDASSLVSSLSMLGLQYLRLGYTGQSGLQLAKAEGLLQRQATSTEVKLRWHVAYTEYLVGIGNVSKATTILSKARAIAVADTEFMDLAKPSTTLSNRVRFNRLLADASYVHSLLAISTGLYKEAARHARQSVAVNRRTWAAIESKMKEKRAAADEDVSSPKGLPFDPLISMRNDKGVPVVASVTHEALDAPEMWSLVPSLYRALMQHSQVFAQQGLLHEATYVAEQAEKVAFSTKSPTLMTDNGSWRADCWAQSDRVDKAQKILDSLSEYSTRQCLSAVGYHSAVARKHHCNSYFDEEVESYNTLEELLAKLKSPAYIRSLQSFSPSVDTLAETIATITLSDSVQPALKPSARGRKPAIRPATRTASTGRTKASTTTKATAKSGQKVAASKTVDASPISDECSTLFGFLANILDRKAVAYLLQDELALALDTLRQSEQLHRGSHRGIQHMWATFKAKFAQGIQQIAADINVNTLPESTIAFPAVGLKERRLSEALAAKSAALSASASGSKGRPKKQTKEDYTATIREARELLVEAHALSSLNRSTQLFTQISLALGQVTVLLSAFSGQETLGFLHPLYAAYMNEIPRCNALKLAQESVEGEKESLSRDELLQWPVLKAASAALVPMTSFQQEYVDILPECYTAVSMALNETYDELYITRYEHGSSPFVLRLPLARQASRDMDEEEFSFEDGKKDFDEIIELSDFSTKTAKDMTSKEARLQWWAEREALDNRLHELLINIENIWLGGFKGIFSQQERRPALLARFRKSLENILNQHLPSRKRKTTTKRPQLDSRVLELFVGLGDACDESIDMDDALMDLIYFVVDILQYNGERNAYDEIDFDAMVVEVQDALKAYHSASSTAGASRHTILILDKNLHPFPWESMPCLEQLSISRLPSLAALQERLVSARASLREPNGTPGHYIQVGSGGTSILNPSKDLSHTLKTIGPRLQELQGSWDFINSRAPTEKEFEDSLRAKDLVLYFGHGSGAQYIKSKSVRRLYEPDGDETGSRPGCATTLLFGCSSVHLTENGVYEPSGMLASYLTAGAPAVVGMLWDVTDKDCDRLAIKAGELWGLWPKEKEDPVPPRTPAKTPGKTAKGKGRVAQLVQEVEGPRDAPKKKSGKKLLVKNEDIDLDGKSLKGVGLDEAVKEARKACVLRYLNGAAAVVYGIPVFLE